MKNIVYINWAIIALLIVFGVFQMITIPSSSMDAAGKGMAQGFVLVMLIGVLILAGLNLINVQWVRVGVLAIFVLSFLLVLG